MNFCLPILKGPMAGCWWSPFSRGKLARVYLGTYEPEQTQAFVQHLRPGDVVFDVGAHVGYYTILSTRRVTSAGRVVAFEPDATNYGYLKTHVSANRCRNVICYRAAIGASNGTSRFLTGNGSGTGHLISSESEGGSDCTVRVLRIDDIVEEIGFVPTRIKIDIEGAEMEALRGAEQTIRVARPTFFLSTHGEAVHRECRDFLSQRGYDMVPIHGDDLQTATEILASPCG